MSFLIKLPICLGKQVHNSGCKIGPTAPYLHLQSRSWCWTLASPPWSLEPDLGHPPAEWDERTVKIRRVRTWQGGRGRDAREANDETLLKRNATAHHAAWHHAHYMNHLAQWHPVSDYLKLQNTCSVKEGAWFWNSVADLVMLCYFFPFFYIKLPCHVLFMFVICLKMCSITVCLWSRAE